MAARKDMMRVIRRDAGFSAKLGFGDGGVTETAAPAMKTSEPRVREAAAPVQAVLPDPDGARESAPQAKSPDAATAKGHALPAVGLARDINGQSSADKCAGTRGTVVYVALSLTEAQATRAETWAKAAHCSVPFLIRKVAQGMRAPVCEDWRDGGMPKIDEQRGSRGKCPTSVTLTLPQEFAADLAARHDPLGLQGLGRTIGPAFRARFENAFDAALAAAGFGEGQKGA